LFIYEFCPGLWQRFVFFSLSGSFNGLNISAEVFFEASWSFRAGYIYDVSLKQETLSLMGVLDTF
jgi:hypothetical protein